ncbi:transmembrane protein 241 isoform X2 [Trichomycterus rosablanca]|uniref:transmembrane protein 241 isoform X2 n=1 Tax=Trichomycterus rosablanca TaxID=2290929 RepID=UPI002F351C68
MNLARDNPGLVFCIFFVASCFTNKYVLSVLRFTYPTLFQGWQSFSGAVLLWVTGRLGWVEINGFPRSAAVSWLPATVLFLGNIYGGSKALSILPIPFFFVLQSVSEVVFFLIIRFIQREISSWIKTFSKSLMLMSAITLVLQNPQFGPDGYIWAVIHFCCVGSYRVFQKKSSHLSAILGFSVVLLSVKIRSALSLVQCAVWVLLAKILASSLSIFVFSTELRPLTSCCILMNFVGEALSIYCNKVQER